MHPNTIAKGGRLCKKCKVRTMQGVLTHNDWYCKNCKPEQWDMQESARKLIEWEKREAERPDNTEYYQALRKHYGLHV